MQTAGKALISARLALAVLAGLAIPAVAVVAFRQGLFSGIPLSYRELLAAIAGLALGLLVVSRILQGPRASPATLLVLVALLAFVSYCGPAVASATGLLGLCAISILPEQGRGSSGSDAVIALVVGLSILSGLVGWLLPFPVHGPRVYLAVAAMLCLWRRHLIARRLVAIWEGWRVLERDAAGWLLVVVCTASVAALGLWLPSLNYDDNAAHLILPYQLLANGYYHLDVSTQAWAVAPWANNALNGISALFAGGEARAAVNALWLLVGLNGAWRLAMALGSKPSAGLAAVAAYASLPLTGYFMTTMQVDGASAAVLLQLAALLVAHGRSLPYAVVVGSLMGLLAGLKAPNAIYAFPAVMWLVWLAMQQRDLRWLLKVAGTAILLGGASYFYAAVITANPVFPLFNATFQSQYFPPINLEDNRWTQQLSWGALWNMTYHTDRFGEHYPGAFGLALLALVPSIAMEMARHRASRMVGLWSLVAGILMFSQIQYIRYLFPATAVLVVVGTTGLARLLPGRVFAGVMVLLLAANALLLPSTSWLLRDDPWTKLALEGPSALSAVETEKMPERALLRRVLEETPHACIIIASPEAPFGAIAAGRAIVVKNPYDSRMSRTYEWANADPAGERWERVLASTGMSHVITGSAPAEGLLKALSAKGFEPVDAQGPSTVWASQDRALRICEGGMTEARDEAHRRFHPGDRH